MRKNNHHSIPTTEVKSRVKMWRSGKNWVYGLLFFFGMAGISFGQANLVHADTTELSTETEKGTIASQLTDRAVPLQTSVSKSADDSTNTATSDSEPDISGTNAEQTDKTVETSTAEANGSDTTDTTAPATDSEPTTAGEQTKSATTESPVSDPVNLSTTDSTETTGATDRADSSTATKSDATPVKEQSDSETASSSDTTTTTSPDETANTETPTTDQTASSAHSETSSTSETPVSDDSTKPVTEDTPSTVDTSNTPLPEVSYKTLLSVNADSSTDSPTVVATDPLPAGFSVSDPDYPENTYHDTIQSGLYSFFEGTAGSDRMVLSVNRNDLTEIHAEILNADGQSVASDQIVEVGKTNTIGNWSIIDNGSGIDSLYVKNTNTKFVIAYDAYSYRDGDEAKTEWDGYAVLKPLEQKQTTSYVDQDGVQVADPVIMTGLSGQKYTTVPTATLPGYQPTDSGNTTGYMSPFMENGQTFDEEIYLSGVDKGTLTYTVKDVNLGTMDISFKARDGMAMLSRSTLQYIFEGQTGDVALTSAKLTGGYTVKNIYIPQTTSITYTYDASSVNVPVKFVDENNHEITPTNDADSSISLKFKAVTQIKAPTDLAGYTYDDDPSLVDVFNNPESYQVTDFAHPGTIILHYKANSESVTVKHVDANNKPIGTDTTLKGKFGQSITIDKTTDKDHWNIQGYKATDDSVSYTFIDGVQTVEVPYTQVFTAPIHYVDNSGNAIDPNLLTDAPQTLSGGKGDNVNITSPVISGYTAFSDNPTSYTLSENDTKGVTLRYVPTTVDITWETPAGSDTPVLTSNAGTPVAGQPISADDPTGPKWPTSLTTPGLDKYPQNALGNDGMVRTVLETVNQYVSSDLTKTTTNSSHYVYFRRNASIDFSDPTAPSVKFGDWEVFAGPENTEFNFLLGSKFYPASDYMAGVGVFQFNAKTQIAKAFDANGNPIALTDMDAAGQMVYGLPAVQVTADTPNLTYNIVVYPLDDLQRTFTRTVNFVKNDGQPIPDVDPVVQTVTATREPTLDFSNPTAPKATGYSDWTLSANEFTAVPATAIPGYLAPSSGIDELAIDVDTTPSSTTAALTYTPITGTYTITTPEGDVTENHWTTDPDDPSKLAKVTVPTIENYTPVLDDGTPLEKDPNTGDYIIPAPTAPNASVNITYHEDTSSVTVDFTDYTNPSNAPWPSQTFSGEPGKSVKYSQDKNGNPLTKYHEGYLLLFDGTLDASVYGSEAQTVNMGYMPVKGNYEITPINGGDPEVKPFAVDPETPTQYLQQTIPVVEGYTAVIDHGDNAPGDIEVDPDDSTRYLLPTPTDTLNDVTIKYIADQQQLTVHYMMPAGVTAPADANLTGESGSDVVYTDVIKSIAGYVYVPSESKIVDEFDYDSSTLQTTKLVYKAVGDYTYTTPGTDTPTTMTYTTDQDNPSVATGHIPYTPGFTPQIDNKDIPLIDKDNPSKGYDFTPADPTQPTTITYAGNEQKLTVHFKNTKNETIADDVTVTGGSATTIEYDKVAKLIDGYVYDKQASTLTNPLDTDDGVTQEATLIYKASGKYTYTTPGTDTPTTTIYTTDPDDPSVVTGHVPYTPGFTPQINGNDIPLIDKDNPSKGYDFTPVNPTASTTITYIGNDQTLTVHFETADRTEISGKVTLTGASGGPVDYSTVNKQLTGFILKTDGTLSTTKYDTDDDQDQSVILTYAALGGGVTVTTPTGEKTTTPYTNDSTEPKDPKTVDPITIAYVPGYTPSSDNGDVTPVKDPEGKITGYTLIPTEPTEATSVTYDADSRSIRVAFVDNADKKEIAGHSEIELLGVTDGTIDYTKINKLINGYVLVSDGTKGKTTFSANDDGTPFTILYNEIGTGVTLTTPDPDNPDGQQTTKTYTNDPTDPSTVLPIDVPYIPGYTPSTPEEEGVVEPKDPKDITKGYTFTPSNPSQPANVKYNADQKSIQVAFVNDEGKQEIAGHPAIELLGVTDETIDYTKINKLIDGYVLVSDGTKDKTTFAANDDGTPFTILYNKIGTGVTLTTPDPDDPNGQQTTKAYTNDPTDPSTVLPIDVPYIAGYTPTTPETVGKVEPKDPKDLTKGYTFTPSNPAQPSNVKYNADQKSIQVAFVSDADKQEIAGHPAIELRGVTDGTIDYTKINKLINGYVLVSDGTKGKTTFSANDDGTPFTILYNEIGTGLTLTTPDPHDPNGQQTTKAYTNDPENPSTVLPIDVPYIAGYTPTTPETVGKVEPKDPKDLTKGYTFTPKDPAQPANVKYNADSKNLNVVFVDQADPETPLKPTQNLSGVTDGDIDYTTVEKVIDGYVLLTDETVGKTKFTAADHGQTLTLTYQKTDGGYVGKTPAGVDLTTPYVTDPEDPESVQPITIPTVPGYTLDIENGKRTPIDDNDPSKGYTVTPIDPSEPTTVSYTAEMGKSVQVAYVDEDGVEISGHPVKVFSGQTDQTIDYGTKAIAGYVLTTDGTKDKTKFAATDDGTLLTISYEKIVVTITKPTDDGNTETVPVDTTTPGHVDYIPGYTPKTDDGKALVPVDEHDLTQGYTVPAPADPTTPTTVNYDPDLQTVHVVLVDTAGNAVTNDEGQSTYTFHGVTGEGIHEWEVDKQAAAYIISDDGTLQKFVYDNDDAHDQVVEIVYLKTTAFNDPDGGTTTLLTDGNGKVVSIDKKWGTGIDTNALIENNKVTLTPNTDDTPIVLTTGVPDGDGTVTGMHGNDGNIILTQKIPNGVITETITPDGQLSFSQVPAAVSPTPEAYYETQITHDPDGGTTTTKTNGNGDITAIDRNWPDGDHSHVVIDIDTGIATITETPNGGSPSEPVAVQPGITATVGKTTLDNHDPINLTHAGTDGDSTIATITPEGKRTFTYTHTTDDPDGGTTTTKTNGNGDIIAIDRNWPDGDHSHVDIDTDTGIATITETPNGGSPSEPVDVQPGTTTTVGKTTLDNHDPINLTHAGTDGDSTIATITPDGKRTFTYTHTTDDPDGGKTTTTTNTNGKITTIDKDWGDGDHSHVDIDTGTGIATITEKPAGGSPSEPVTVQPGESDKNGKTTLDNGEPDGNIVLTHRGTDGDKTTETITPDTSRSFSRQPAGVQTTKKDYFETQITHDPDGGTTTTKTNGHGDITDIDRNWPDGDHSHVDIDTKTGIATFTETPAGGNPSEPITVQPGESGKSGKTALDNGEPDGNIALTHPGTDGGKTTETITQDTSRSFSRQPGGVSTDASHYFETQITHDPDGGTTTTKTNGDGDITTIDKDWSDGDHSHVDIDTGTGIAKITETPKGGSPSEPMTVQPGESGKNGKTTLDNGEPDGNIVLTHRGTDGDKTTETITPGTSRSFSRQPGGVSTDASHYYTTQVTHDPDGGTTTTKTNGDGDITTIDKDWGDGDHSHVDINTETGIATITETPNGGEAGTPVEVQPGESGKSGKTTLDNGEPDGNIVLTHQETDGGKTTETITPDTSRSFSRQPGGVSTDASHYYTTQVTHDPDGGTTTTKTNGDGDITTIDKDWGDGDHSYVDIDTDTGIATITETPNEGEAGTPVEVQPGESGKNGKTTLDNGEPDGNIVLTHQGTDGDKTTETITPDTSRSFSRQPGGVSTDASHYYTTQVTHDPDGGTTTTKTNGDGDITTIDKDWGDGDHSHVDIDTDTGITKITETPKGGSPSEPITVQPGESGKNGKTTLDNGEPDGNIVLTHQGTDGDKTTETITPDTSRSFSRMPAPIFVTAEDFYDTRTTHDSDGGTTTTVTNGNGDVTTIDKDWGDGSHTHVTVDPNTGDATATDTDANGNTSTPVTVKPGETGTTGQTTITNGQPDGDIILSHEGTDGDQVEAAISDDGHVRVSLPDTDAEAKAETNVAVTSTPGSTTSANYTNLPQTSATSRTDVQGKKSTATQLPETGDKQNGLGLIGATLLAGLAMLGFGKRRRDDED